MYFVQLCRQLWLAILHTGHCHIVFERMIIATVNLQGRWTDAADHAPRGPAARRRRGDRRGGASGRAGGARGDGAATMWGVSFVRGQRGPRWSRSGLQVALLGCSATKPRGEALEVVERCAHELLRSSHRRLSRRTPLTSSYSCFTDVGRSAKPTRPSFG